MRTAEIRFHETEAVKTALMAIQPEAEEGMNRVSLEISVDPAMIRIAAEDSHALRAAVNSYLRWLGVTKDIADVYQVKR